MLEENGFLKKVSRETEKTGKLTENLDKTQVGDEKGEIIKSLATRLERWETNSGKKQKNEQQEIKTLR